VKDETEIATVAEPGAVFGELSILLDQPHTADVLALETSQFHVAEATSLLTHNPIAVLYVATVLAHRLDGANHALFQLKGQLQAGQPHSVVVQRVARVEGLLAVSSASSMPGTHSIRICNIDMRGKIVVPDLLRPPLRRSLRTYECRTASYVTPLKDYIRVFGMTSLR